MRAFQLTNRIEKGDVAAALDRLQHLLVGPDHEGDAVGMVAVLHPEGLRRLGEDAVEIVDGLVLGPALDPGRTPTAYATPTRPNSAKKVGSLGLTKIQLRIRAWQTWVSMAVIFIKERFV